MADEFLPKRSFGLQGDWYSSFEREMHSQSDFCVMIDPFSTLNFSK